VAQRVSPELGFTPPSSLDCCVRVSWRLVAAIMV